MYIIVYALHNLSLPYLTSSYLSLLFLTLHYLILLYLTFLTFPCLSSHHLTLPYLALHYRHLISALCIRGMLPAAGSWTRLSSQVVPHEDDVWLFIGIGTDQVHFLPRNHRRYSPKMNPIPRVLLGRMDGWLGLRGNLKVLFKHIQTMWHIVCLLRSCSPRIDTVWLDF
jgi:hypothetical protein